MFVLMWYTVPTCPGIYILLGTHLIINTTLLAENNKSGNYCLNCNSDNENEYTLNTHVQIIPRFVKWCGGGGIICLLLLHVAQYTLSIACNNQ